MIKLAAATAALFLGLNSYVFYVVSPTEELPPRRSFEELPLRLGEWACPELESVGEKIETRLGVTDYLHCNFRRTGEPTVNVYVGYHERQVREGAQGSAESSIHPPRHCLPGSGWQIVHAKAVPFPVGGEREIQANQLIIAKGNQRQLVYYWYQERGRAIASDYWKIVYLFWDRATRGRSDGSLVRFTTWIDRDDVATADARIRELAGELMPQLALYVPD